MTSVTHIRSIIRRLTAPLKRFAVAREGVAAVEFALILPFMLALYIGSIELSDLISVDSRVTVIAGTVGDLVARVDGDLAESELVDYFSAAEEIITPYSVTGLEQIVTCVKVDGGVATVEWSRASGGATPRADDSTIDLPDAITDISEDKFVIVSETAYSYKPLLGMVFQTAIDLNRQNFHLPRFGQSIQMVDG